MTQKTASEVTSIELEIMAFFFLIFQISIREIKRLLKSISCSPFTHGVELFFCVYVYVTRSAEKPSEQDGLDIDCCELVHPRHGVWQPDVLSPHCEGDSACA